MPFDIILGIRKEFAMDEYLRRLQKTWDQLAINDPLWAIVSFNDKKNRKWGIEDFFALGQSDIEGLFVAILDELKLSIKHHKSLDFGCGAGRLTQALCTKFHEVHGVDISQKMIDMANIYNQHPHKCFYHCNTTDHLMIFKDNTFDFILSHLVLQHIAPHMGRKYIREFMRLIKPGGLIVFQIPSHRIRENTKELPYEMHTIHRDNICELILNHSCKISYIRESDPTAAGEDMISYTYFVMKQA